MLPKKIFWGIKFAKRKINLFALAREKSWKKQVVNSRNTDAKIMLACTGS